MYWARALAQQSTNTELQSRFAEIANDLERNESKIIAELNAAQGKAVDLGGYYQPDPVLTSNAMRPSATFNAIIDSL